MAERKINIWFALLLGWMLPGLGHLYARRAKYGAFYFVTIAGLYIAGWVLSRGSAVTWDAHGTYFLLQLLASPITLSLEFMRDRGDMGLGESLPILDHQSGTVYAATAGLLNLISLCELHRRHMAPDAPGPGDTLRAELVVKRKDEAKVEGAA
jgi:hypothetical protein